MVHNLYVTIQLGIINSTYKFVHLSGRICYLYLSIYSNVCIYLNTSFP